MSLHSEALYWLKAYERVFGKDTSSIFLKDFIENQVDLLSVDKHLTVSSLVYQSQTKSILLHYHQKMDAWIQPGGHVNPKETLQEAMIREVREETGVKVIVDANYSVIAVNYYPVAENHFHYDICFLSYTDEVDLFEGNQWVSPVQIQQYTLDKTMHLLSERFDFLFSVSGESL